MVVADHLGNYRYLSLLMPATIVDTLMSEFDFVQSTSSISTVDKIAPGLRDPRSTTESICILVDVFKIDKEEIRSVIGRYTDSFRFVSDRQLWKVDVPYCILERLSREPIVKYIMPVPEPGLLAGEESLNTLIPDF